MINMGNMFKLFGCILIIVSSAGIGISMSQELQRHLEELEEIQKIFYLLRSEFHYTKATFGEIFEKIGRKTSGVYREWLMLLATRLKEKGYDSFVKLWCETIDQKLIETSLKKEEIQELKNIGKDLEYTESMDLYIEQLEYRIKHMREIYRSKKKICRSMGITGGVFLVIVLA